MIIIIFIYFFSKFGGVIPVSLVIIQHGSWIGVGFVRPQSCIHQGNADMNPHIH